MTTPFFASGAPNPFDRWAFYAAEATTGSVIADLPLTDFAGEVKLRGDGTMSAQLPLSHLDPTLRREIIGATVPGRHTILGARDGVVRGEWMIWGRTRRNDYGEINLAGSEMMSIADHRVIQAWSWTQREQLDIAADLVNAAFRGSDFTPVGVGSIRMSIASYSPSGQLRDREWKLLDGMIGPRLRELSEVDNGFEYSMTTGWSSAGRESVTRVLSFAYPRAGIDNSGIVLDMAGVGFQAASTSMGGANLLSFELNEDAKTLASRAWTIGQTDGDKALTAAYQDVALVTTGLYPYYDAVRSYTTVSKQTTLDDYAKALWTDSQIPEMPVSTVILADVPPVIGDYGLGDVVAVHLDPSPNFPDGYDGKVRILGWSFKPPKSGVESVTLSTIGER